VLQYEIRYLKRAYNSAYAKYKLSDDPVDIDGIVKENLIVLQLTTKNL
jgi:hypothetical protein